MAQYYPAPVPFYYAVPAVPVAWYVPTRAKPNPSTHSPAAHRRRHTLNSTTPDVHSPWKRLQQSPPGSPYAHAPAGVPPTPELRTVPLPWVTTARANADQPRNRYPPPPPHRRSAANQAQAPPPSAAAAAAAAAAPAPPLVDPFLAVPHHPNTRPPIVWDMARHPSHAVLDHPSLTHDALRRRCAVRAGGPLGRQPLRALVLVFPLLPAVEVEIVPSPGPEPYVSLWDVLEGLYYALRAPIPTQELRALGSGEPAALLAAAEARVPAGERAHTLTLRRIDYLARRRWFVGVRPALGYEVPEGRRRGEVFVVEVGTGTSTGTGAGS